MAADPLRLSDEGKGTEDERRRKGGETFLTRNSSRAGRPSPLGSTAGVPRGFAAGESAGARRRPVREGGLANDPRAEGTPGARTAGHEWPAYTNKPRERGCPGGHR